jgi:hypothetical protein
VDGKKHVVKVIDGGAEFKESESGNPLLRIRITAEVDGVKSEYTITFGRRGRYNAVRDAPRLRPTLPAAGRQTRRG